MHPKCPSSRRVGDSGSCLGNSGFGYSYLGYSDCNDGSRNPSQAQQPLQQSRNAYTLWLDQTDKQFWRTHESDCIC